MSSPEHIPADIQPTPKPTSRKLNSDETAQSLAREGYNTSAQTYLNWTSSLPDFRMTWLSKLYSRFQKTNPTPLVQIRALDLGSGAGVPATLDLAQTCAHVTCVEISSSQIQLAFTAFKEAKIPASKYEFIESDMVGVNFPDGSFDITCAFYSIIHLPLAEQREVLGRIFSWLKPGGMLLFNAAKMASSEDGNVVEEWLGMKAFWASFGQERMLEIVKEVGFDIIESQVVESEEDAAFTWIIAAKPGR